MDKYNPNNIDHDYFYWSQEALDKANLRKSFLHMVQDWIASIFQKDEVFKQIDEGKKRILIKESKEDVEWQITRTFLELDDDMDGFTSNVWE